MSWWHYLLLVNFYLILFFGFYTLLLRKETFFQLNRIYLVAAAILSFAIPLIQADWVKDLFITQQVQQTIYNTPINTYTYNFTYNITPADDLLTIGEALGILYIIVASVLVLKLMWELIVLKKEIEKPNPSVAYSFFKKISLGNNTDNHDVIAQHEHVHARQWHTIDVLIIESIVIINWFNPVVYLYRFAIKYIHEFIADNQVLQSGTTDKADYAMLLLTQTFDVPSNHLVSNFYNHSLLKQRIIMLQKNKSKRIALAKYGLSAPLFVLMLILSSATVNNSKALKNITTKAEDVLLVPVSSSAAMLADSNEVEVAPAIILADTIKYTQQPSYPGGRTALDQYMTRNVRYPAMDRENNIQGKVNLQFNVETDGSVTDVVAVSGPSQTLKDAAVAAMKNSPNWIPGYKDGKLVKMPYSYEVNFTLSDEGASDRVYTVLETQPKFPGGTQNFMQYLAANIRYPRDDRKNNVQGRVVAQFVVEKDGSLADIKVVRSPSAAMGEEAVRVLSTSPKWEPGIQGGRPVRAQFTVPVDFTLGDDNKGGNNQVYTVLETQPKFPGGTQNFLQYLAANIRYPADDRKNNVQGRVVAQFIVEKDGSLSDIKVVRSPSAAMGEEAVRVLSNSPKWEPGKQNGSAVRSQFTVPVNFTLGGGSSNTSNTPDAVVNSLLTIRGASLDPNKKPLILIDGVEASDINKLDQNSIESMTVLRGTAAASLYGEKAKNGAILIITKGKIPKEEAPTPPTKKQ
ncbi:MAG: TonB family protein [Sphingobacteriaceae bacterium]|nr:MAG: TonB family protein [Sphingobacteriaceae bacterium]